MTDFNDSTRFLQYDNFYIGNEEALYMFSLSGLVDADVGKFMFFFFILSLFWIPSHTMWMMLTNLP